MPKYICFFRTFSNKSKKGRRRRQLFKTLKFLFCYLYRSHNSCFVNCVYFCIFVYFVFLYNFKCLYNLYTYSMAPKMSLGPKMSLVPTTSLQPSLAPKMSLAPKPSERFHNRLKLRRKRLWIPAVSDAARA